MENQIQETELKENIEIAPEGGHYLREAASWAKLLSVLGFIGCGITLLLSFFIKSILKSVAIMSSTSVYGYPPETMETVGTLYAVMFFICAVISFFPTYFLFVFSISSRKALRSNDSSILTKAFKFLKNHYMFIGILAIISILFYAFLFITMLVMVAAAM